MKKMMKNKQDSDFITRTLRTSALLGLILFPFGLYYLGLYPFLAIYSGFVWSLLNLMFLSGLVRSTLRPEGANTGKAVALMLVKFPLLYAAGYFLLQVPVFEPMLLMTGFTSLLGIMLLKVLGRLFLGLDNSTNEPDKLQKAH